MTDKVKLFPNSSSGEPPPVLPPSSAGSRPPQRPRKSVLGRVVMFLFIFLLLGGGAYAVWFYLLNAQEQPAETSTSQPEEVDQGEDADGVVRITEGAAVQSGWYNGFIVERNGEAYLMAQRQALTGYDQPVIHTTSGKQVEIDPTDVYLSRNLGIVAVRVSNADDLFPTALWRHSSQPLRLMEDVDAQASVGDTVYLRYAYDKPKPAEEYAGQLTQIGPRTLEHSLELTVMENGCPIIHADSGEVIGVVAGSTIDLGNRTESQVLTLRLDNVEDWQRSDSLN